METLEEALERLEPRIDIVKDCLGIGRFAEIAITPDGCFLARARGDCDSNYFLVAPTRSALARTKALFGKLSAAHQQELIRRLHARGIPPQALGIPEPTD